MHACKYGDRFCGHFGVTSLCIYCKRKYELELEAEQNELAGARDRQRRESNAMANEALAELIVEHPKASLGAFLGIVGLGLAVNHYSNKPKTTKKTPSIGSGKKK